MIKKGRREYYGRRRGEEKKWIGKEGELRRRENISRTEEGRKRR